MLYVTFGYHVSRVQNGNYRPDPWRNINVLSNTIRRPLNSLRYIRISSSDDIGGGPFIDGILFKDMTHLMTLLRLCTS